MRAFLIFAILLFSAAAHADDAAIKRGTYIFKAAGSEGCHTSVKPKGAFLAGGRRMQTPFGGFYTPNITSDKTHGIGGWTYEQFVAAMREGKTPDGLRPERALPSVPHLQTDEP